MGVFARHSSGSASSGSPSAQPHSTGPCTPVPAGHQHRQHGHCSPAARGHAAAALGPRVMGYLGVGLLSLPLQEDFFLGFWGGLWCCV